MTRLPASRILRPEGTGRFVLLCDHASNHIPGELRGLGLDALDLTRHIAWDIGAAAVTELLAEILDAPAILCNTSRLVIDANRQLDARDLIPKISDHTVIPGNADVSEADKADRIARWFQPYHDAAESVLSEREEPIVISIHSMTPSLDGQPRPWQIALSSHLDRRITDPVLEALRREGDILVGDNQPYTLDPAVDYSTPFHALRRGLLALQVEFRQDEIADVVGQERWAARFSEALYTGIGEINGSGSIHPKRT